MDTILTGTLHYKDMMPDVTITEFLDGLYNKFGMLYYIDSNARTVKLKFLKDVLIPTKSGIIELDKLKTEEPIVTYSMPKQLKLSANREIEQAKTLYDTFEEFLDVYEYQFTEFNKVTSLKWGATSGFDSSFSRYFITDAFATQRVFSSDFFDWDKKDELEYEEIKMEDLCVSLNDILGFIYLFYLVGYKHNYSDVNISGEIIAPVENPAKLAFAFGWGLTNRTGLGTFNYFFASQFNRDENGNFIYDVNGEKYDISLTCNREDGLFNRFWKEYDAYLRHSNFEVKCNLKLSDADIFNLEMFKTAIINNQPLLPKQIKYKLNQKDSIAECTFQTLRLYEPNNLVKEQEIPVYIPQKYWWSFSDVKVPDLEREFDEAGIAYGYYSGRRNTSIIINEEEISVKKILMMPPTEEQYLNQEKRVFVYKYQIFRKIDGIYNFYIIEQTVTYLPALIEY